MALKFKCDGCGREIITQYLKVGEAAKCRNCGAMTTVPETASETTELPFYNVPVVSKRDEIEPRPGIVRPVWKVLIFLIITLGIYYWVYLFKTIREIQNNFKFDEDGINPSKLRLLLKIHLIVWIGLLILDSCEIQPSTFMDYTSGITIFYIWPFIGTLIAVTVFMFFWFSYVDLLYACQFKAGTTGLNKSLFWTLIAAKAILSITLHLIGVALDFIQIQSSTLISNIISMAYLDLIVLLIIFFLAVNQVNMLWRAPQQV